MRTVDDYMKEFEPIDMEIAVYITKGFGGAGILENYHEVTSYFPAMVDLRTGECTVTDGRIESLVKNEDYDKNNYYRFIDNGIYRLLVTKCIPKDLGLGMLASMNNRYLVKKVIEENASFPELEAIRTEYTKDVIIEVCCNKFTLNRLLNWFEGTAGILDGSCIVYLCLDEDSKVEAKNAARRFEELMQNFKELDNKFKVYCTERMLDSVNEWKENEDDPDITSDKFKENMGTPNEMVIHNNGEVEILYGDGFMFGGHAIQVSINENNEIKDCEIVG